jgi:hypothetical protein
MWRWRWQGVCVLYDDERKLISFLSSINVVKIVRQHLAKYNEKSWLFNLKHSSYAYEEKCIAMRDDVKLKIRNMFSPLLIFHSKINHASNHKSQHHWSLKSILSLCFTLLYYLRNQKHHTTDLKKSMTISISSGLAPVVKTWININTNIFTLL